MVRRVLVAPSPNMSTLLQLLQTLGQPELAFGHHRLLDLLGVLLGPNLGLRLLLRLGAAAGDLRLDQQLTDFDGHGVSRTKACAWRSCRRARWSPVPPRCAVN